MLLFWLVLAVMLTLVGAVIALLTQDAADEHEQELEYETRIEHQRNSIELARCEADPNCREAHTRAQHMLSLRQSSRP